MHDLIIIGAGPAGLSAAIYAKRAGLDALVIERAPTCGGQVLITYEVDNYAGLPGINGFDLGMKFKEHADKLGVAFAEGDVTSLSCTTSGDDHTAGQWHITTDAGEYDTKTVLIASGADHNKLGVPGEAEYTGKGVSYCATCDGAFFRNKVAVVNGGGDVAVEDAIFLARGCSKVYLVHRRDALRATKVLQDELLSLPNVEVVWNSVVTAVTGDGNRVGAVTLKDVQTGEERSLETAALFVAIGIHPLTEICTGLARMDENGYLLAGEDGVTSAPGLFVAGDARKKRLRQIVTAVADGANAVTAVTDYLVGKA